MDVEERRAAVGGRRQPAAPTTAGPTTAAAPTGPTAAAALTGAWSLVATGATHLVAVGIGAAAPESAAMRAARLVLTDTVVSLGVDRSMWQVFMGFSLLMGVFVAGLGALDLLVLRHARHLFTAGRAVAGLNLAITLTAFTLSVLLLPAPPIVLLGLATAAFGTAFGTAPLRRPAQNGRT